MPTSAGSAAPPVLVAGGTGFVGGIIARSLVADGRTVIVPARSADRLSALLAACADFSGRLVPLEVSGSHPHFQAAERLAADGRRPGAVVAALGGWSKAGALIDLPGEQWERALRDHLTSHLEAMQAYVPLLGGSVDPTYISVTGAAQHMLTSVMRAEAIGATVRFHELSLMAAVAGDDRNLDPTSQITPSQITLAIDRLIGNPLAEAFGALYAERR
jgi:NAD(P)-dependent dehydrogenase (short-subunit alcohol dehydrogenase family)